MLSFEQLSRARDLVPVGERWWGDLAWLRGGDLGSDVRHFRDRVDLEAYVRLHEYAHLWVHRDYDHDAWLVLDVCEPEDVGMDYVTMKRRGGVPLHHFDPAMVDDPVAAPAKLARLIETVDLLSEVHAVTDADRFVAGLVRARVATSDHRIVWDAPEQRFYVVDLDPSHAELEAWRAVMPAEEAPSGTRVRSS
jgi:hypothetical protein